MKTDPRTDDAELFDGAPIGLQVMCRRLQEEKVLELLGCILSAMSRLEPDGMQ